MLRWLELSADYRCNNRCVGCFSSGEGGPSLGTREAAAALAEGRRQGAHALWLGGGEPTLRRDLFALLAEARRLGYTRIKLQTNGMMLAYPAFTERCATAGVTEVAFSIKGAGPETHDRLARTPGCHALMTRGIAEARRCGLALEGDVLVYRSNAHELPEIVRHYTAEGVGCFRLWLMSAVDQGDEDLSGEVPRVADVMPHVTAAMDLRLSDRPDFILSLHTPPCTVPASHRACLFHSRDLALLVVDASGHRFRLEDSPIEGGHYLEGCGRCVLRPRCGGVRRDYVALHGGDEFRPVME
jgi:cyclic pyranopterin phosphate synthase